ncbi:MAG: 50S ribosomal protein L25/general stress protein Ctc [Hyphomicrobiales bacterium]|nr:50S ribosomal protein L25/general stress protein Ctc [Hyphomicrobiales bacterium]
MGTDNTLNAQLRDRVGKGASRELRRNKMVPAVIYGDNKDPLPIALDAKEMTTRLHAGGFAITLFDVKVDGDSHRVLAKDYQLDPVKDTIQHIDFFRITKGATLVVEIPVHFVNEDESPGITRGGVLNIVRHTIEVECHASAIPEAIIGDMTGLDIGDSLNISGITLPEGVKPTIEDRDFTVATIAAPAVLGEEPTDEDTPEVEIIGEETEEDEDEASEE